MSMEISFPGGKKVQSDYNGYTVTTDQPVKYGGEGSAPSPFDLFLASLGTCAGFYVVAFCKKHKVDGKEIKISLDFQWNEKETQVEKITINVALPEDFPEKLKPAIIKSINLCAVKKHMENPPAFETVIL